MRPRLCRAVRGQHTPERADQMPELKRLANETVDGRSVEDRCCSLLAISARQNDLYVWPGLHCRGEHLLTEGAWNRHIEQQRVNLPGAAVEQLDCIGSIVNFQDSEACLGQHLADSLAKRMLIFHNQYRGLTCGRCGFSEAG